MKEEFKYRKATLADIPKFQQLGPLSYSQLKDALTPEHWQAMEANLKNEDTYLQLVAIARGFVCEYKNEMVGMVFLVPSGNPTSFFQEDWAYIRLLGVHPEFGGRGIGRKLMEMCVEVAKDSGEKTLALHTSEFQNAGRHIYESMGFKILRPLDNKFDKKFWLYTLNLIEIKYHKADINDIQALIDLRIGFLIDFGGDQPTESIEILKKALKPYFLKSLNKGCMFYIAKANDVPVGIGGMIFREQPGYFKNPSGKIGYLINMYTLPHYRRKGICSNILNLLLDDAKSIGIPAFELHATKEGEYVYKKNGFEIHNEPTYRKHIATS